MNDMMEMAAVAALGALVPGALGWLLLRWLRRRALSWSIAMVSAVTVAAMWAGTALTAQAMFLSGHDLGVVRTVIAMSAAVSLVIAVLLGRQVALGSKALARATRRLGEAGSFDAPAEPAAAELADLAVALATTSARLAESRRREQALEESRRELIAWISHDLRTPLAGLRAMTEALEDGVAADPARYHRQMRVEVERLSAMVSDLFELSRIQAGALVLAPGRISLFDLVDGALAGADALARAEGVWVVGERVEAVPVVVDAKEMTRVLGNLLANAIRATPPRGSVRVRAYREAESAVLTVTDECGGIAEEDLGRVFETGWRGGPARTPIPAQSQGTGGAGLGLAIVRGIVSAHRGEVTASNVPGGCRFTVRLPVSTSP